MKTKFYTLIALCTVILFTQKLTAQADQQLSNLTAPTKINVDLLPNNNIRSLGNINKAWRRIYIDSFIFLNNSRFIVASYANDSGNTGIGANVLNFTTTGSLNTAGGYRTLYSNTTGSYNTAYGYQALYSNTSGVDNTAIGVQALYTNNGIANTAVGYRSLYSNTSGNYNAALGEYSLLSNTTGSENTAVGFNVLRSNTTGSANTAIGDEALPDNTTGYSNTALGSGALSANTTGFYNTAIGNNAITDNTTGAYNTSTGLQSLFSNKTGSYNTANGTFALYFNTGDRNTAIGYDALIDNTSGFSNTAIGYVAGLSNTTGSNNVFIGDSAGFSNTTGIYNTLIGGHAGTFTTGSYNTLIGEGAGSFTTGKSNSFLGVAAGFGNGPGYNNVYIGDSSGYYGFAGKQNTIVGFQAGLHNLTDYNCFFGQQSGINNTNGSKNMYLGYHAGNSGTTGSSNTVIGYGADISDGTFTNSTAIGNLAISGASNRVRIGNGSVTSIGGAVAWTNFSDERIKNNIKDNVPGLAFINLLKPVTYHFDLSKEDAIRGLKNDENWTGKYDIQQKQFTGFLAQDVEAAAKKINYDFSGVDAPKNDKDLYGLRYAEFVVPLVKAIQELSAKNESLKNTNDDLEARIAKLESMMHVQTATSANQINNTNAVVANLSQNSPNPFSNSTTISYSIPQTFSSAKIIITDKNGTALKQINLSSNSGSVNVDAATLLSGSYQYSLYVDGRLIATKQMITSK